MFEELLRKYQLRVDQIPQPDQEAFDKDHLSIKKSHETQNALISESTTKRNSGRTGKAEQALIRRIALFTQQQKFTQGLHELELEQRELTYLIKEAGALEIEADMVGQLNRDLADVELRLRALHTEKLAASESELGKRVDGLVFPDNPADFTAERTADALAVQQHRLMRWTLEEQQRADAGRAVAEGRGVDKAVLHAQWQSLRDALALAQGMSAAHGIDPAGLDALLDRVDTLGDPANANVDTLFMDAFSTLGHEVSAFIARHQREVQAQRQAALKAMEQGRHSAAALVVMKNFLIKECVDDSTSEEPSYERKLRQHPLRDEALTLLSTHGDPASLQEAVAEHPQAEALQPYLSGLSKMATNDVVQGPFLLNERNELVQKATGNDAEFLAASHSAHGDYNDIANLGKYTYHVTALGNIIRRIRAVDQLLDRREGITVLGLQPRQGGHAGGSCEITEPALFAGTTVTYKDASEANSQNKVASSSNRQKGMRVYVEQRENAVDTLQKDGSEEALRKAVAATSVMLRFPVRAEYLGKFGEDPIHMADNLQLLDGTPVPPEDIECLIHREWIGITEPAFVQSYEEMMYGGS